MRTRTLLAAALVTAALGGCQPAGTEDKAGGRVTTIRLATIDELDGNGMSYGPPTFVESLHEVSEGRLRVEVDTQTFSEEDPDAESRLVEAIAAGDVDGGWPSTRAFAAGGVPGLEVVEAPMTLTSYAAVSELVGSPLAHKLLDRLEGSGLVGLALTVGPLRRPFAAEAPLLGASDWHGQPFRSYNSPVQDAVIEALGARPVHVTRAWPDLVREGDLRGLEFDVAQYQRNGMTTQAGHITGNVVLWPKVFVLSLSQDRWDTLTDQQRTWFREAAARSVAASVAGPYDEATVAASLCASGAEVHLASPEQVRSVEEAVAPVLEELDADPLLAELRMIAAAHPTTDSLEVAECRPTLEVREVDRLRVPGTAARIPDGVYRMELTPEDLEAAGLADAGKGFTGVWTLTVGGGAFAMDCSPLRESTGFDCNYVEALPADFDHNPREVGQLRGSGSTAYFVHDPEIEASQTDCVFPPSETEENSCLPSITNRVSWELADDTLTMRDLVSDSPSYQLVVKPWSRID